MIEWTLNENEQNIFEFPKGMYFIGDLTYLYMDLGGDNISYGDIFNKKTIADLDKRVEIYKDISTGIYTECLGGDGCFEDKDGYSYPIDSGTIGICRVDNKLIENITSNSESCTCMIFYKKIILKVEKDEVKSFKPRDLSVLRDLGRFIYFKDNFNVEFKLLQNNEGIESIQFGEMKIDISNKEYSEMEEIAEEWIIKKMTKREEQEKKEGWISIEDLERE